MFALPRDSAVAPTIRSCKQPRCPVDAYPPKPGNHWHRAADPRQWLLRDCGSAHGPSGRCAVRLRDSPASSFHPFILSAFVGGVEKPPSCPGGSDGEGAAPLHGSSRRGGPADLMWGCQSPFSRASHAAACHGRGRIANVRLSIPIAAFMAQGTLCQLSAINRHNQQLFDGGAQQNRWGTARPGSRPSRTWSGTAPGDPAASRRAGCDRHRRRRDARCLL